MDNLRHFYEVFVMRNGEEQRYIVEANSDYHAAVQVKRMTGLMPPSENHVNGPLMN